MGIVVAVTGAKGGVGKSTLAVALAAYWHEQGRKTVLLDADPQGTARTWAAVAQERKHPAPPTVGPSLKALPTLAQSTEVVVIDCPPRVGEVVKEALLFASVALVPVGPGAPDLWSLGDTLDAIPKTKLALVLSKHASRDESSMRSALKRAGLGPVLASTTPDRPAYRDALAAGLSLLANNPRSAAAREIRALATELDNLRR